MSAYRILGPGSNRCDRMRSGVSHAGLPTTPMRGARRYQFGELDGCALGVIRVCLHANAGNSPIPFRCARYARAGLRHNDSQKPGSGYPAVIIPVLTQHYAMLQRRFTITARLSIGI